jgi:transcriptional regulator with XRE-family HTH domain
VSETVPPGQLIRGLRRQHHLTGEGLAKKAGLSQSKISKIETGAIADIKRSDIDKILNILEAPQSIRQQISIADKSFKIRTYNLNYGDAYADNVRSTQRSAYIRTFMINMIPALLQTIEYRTSLLQYTGYDDFTLKRSMQAILKRQEMLWDKRKHFHFIIYEGALYTSPGTHRTQYIQLDKLERFVGGEGNIKLGIIPIEGGLTPIEHGTFIVYDDWRVVNVLAGREIEFESKDDVFVYLKLFNELDHLADYNDAARMLIRKASNYFSNR